MPQYRRFIFPNGCYRSLPLIVFDVRDSYRIVQLVTLKVLTSAALLTWTSIKTADVVAKHASLRFSVEILFDCAVILVGYMCISVSNKEKCKNIGKGDGCWRVWAVFVIGAILSIPSIDEYFTLDIPHVEISRFYSSIYSIFASD